MAKQMRKPSSVTAIIPVLLHGPRLTEERIGVSIAPPSAQNSQLTTSHVSLSLMAFIPGLSFYS